MSTLFSVAPASYQADGSILWGAFLNPFPQPNNVTHIPAQIAQTDLLGRPVVLTYASMQWTWTTINMTNWSILYQAYRQSRNSTNLPYSLVRIQWPDPTSNNALVSASAHWMPLDGSTRGIMYYQNVTITFTDLGRYDSTVTGTWVPAATI